MRAWTLDDFGLHNLTLREVDTPSPGPGELLVKVSAVSLNFRDKALVDGIYAPEKQPKGLIPVSDSAGVVTAVGEGVTQFAVGDRVTSHLYRDWLDGPWLNTYADVQIGGPLDGGLAEYQILRAGNVVATPAYLSDAEAATLPIAALTTWFSLVEYGDLRNKLAAGGPGSATVLAQGTGGVSVFAIQIAAALGARVIATSSSDEKLTRARELGATDLINYRTTPDWAARVMELTDGEGVDVVLDIAGGEGLRDSVRATRGNGLVAVIGFLTGQSSTVDLMDIIWHQARVQGVAVGHLRAFRELMAFLAEHEIHPVIDTTYTFEQAHLAYEHLARGPFGKIVVTVA